MPNSLQVGMISASMMRHSAEECDWVGHQRHAELVGERLGLADLLRPLPGGCELVGRQPDVP